MPPPRRGQFFVVGREYGFYCVKNSGGSKDLLSQILPFLRRSVLE